MKITLSKSNWQLRTSQEPKSNVAQNNVYLTKVAHSYCLCSTMFAVIAAVLTIQASQGLS